MLQPPIQPKDVGKALKVLVDLGLIKKNTSGIYERTDAVVSSGPVLKSFAVHKLQLETMDLARSAIDRFEKEDRDISTLTLSIDYECDCRNSRTWQQTG